MARRRRARGSAEALLIGDGVRNYGARGCAGVLPSRKAGFRAVEHVIVGPAPCFDLSLYTVRVSY
jgi:hypothetical protein